MHEINVKSALLYVLLPVFLGESCNFEFYKHDFILNVISESLILYNDPIQDIVDILMFYDVKISLVEVIL